jgi:hypothetical protein
MGDMCILTGRYKCGKTGNAIIITGRKRNLFSSENERAPCLIMGRKERKISSIDNGKIAYKIDNNRKTESKKTVVFALTG